MSPLQAHLGGEEKAVEGEINKQDGEGGHFAVVKLKVRIFRYLNGPESSLLIFWPLVRTTDGRRRPWSSVKTAPSRSASLSSRETTNIRWLWTAWSTIIISKPKRWQKSKKKLSPSPIFSVSGRGRKELYNAGVPGLACEPGLAYR